MIYPIIVDILERSGVPYRLHSHPPVTTVEEAFVKAPRLTHNLLKTVVFRIKAGDWILAAVAGNVRIHYKKLADAMGVNRKKLRSISPAMVESELGFLIGGVGPFPVRADIRVVFDAGLEQLGTVFCGSGRNTETVEMDIGDLIRLSRGNVYPISTNGNSRF
jgi:Cys-tRNA(Pro)/Cys-tRNA(Cys) deacylase